MDQFNRIVALVLVGGYLFYTHDEHDALARKKFKDLAFGEVVQLIIYLALLIVFVLKIFS